jgi:hypothetical protein
MTIQAELAELADDLRRRAKACEKLAQDGARNAPSQQLGKATAYAHAAELVEALMMREAER